MADRPRLLLVPMVTELEWLIRPQLEEWADVASFDAPGVGDESPDDDFGTHTIAERGLEELKRLGWERCVLVADEFGVSTAALIANSRPEAVQGMALGHARLSNAADGKRPPLDPEIWAAYQQLAEVDFRSWVRQVMRMTGGERSVGGYGDELSEIYIERVSPEVLVRFLETRIEAGSKIEEHLRAIDAPLLLARHEGCLLFRDEGFDDAVAAFPDARSQSFPDKPSTSPAFAEALREFCAEIA